MATSPIVETFSLSNTGSQVVPLLVVFHTPPEAVPTYTIFGSLSTTAKSSMRPPITAGPISRSLTVIRLAGSDPNHRWVGRSNGDIADRRNVLFVEHRLPGRAVVGRLPHSAGSGADVHDIRIAFDHGEVVNAPAHHRGADLAKFQVFEFVRGVLRCARRDASPRQ